MTCPYCRCEIAYDAIRLMSDPELRKLRAQVSMALRKAPIKAGPGRPLKVCPRCGGLRTCRTGTCKAKEANR